jgi:octaprenyl-diphosphate synthase
MEIISKELSEIRNYIKNGLIEILPEKTLGKFMFASTKMIRSVLALLCFLSQNCLIEDNFYKILSSGEIIHSASLLHDDVIDDAFERRGKPTISVEFSPKVAILTGDYLLSLAFDKISSVGSEVVCIFKESSQKMVEAEIKQFFSRGILISEDEYINICRGKTATLFSAVLEACAYILKIDRDKYKKLGEIFGIAFQIKNDLNAESEVIDKQNKIYTAKDILGIEKTKQLLDNYKEEMQDLIKDFPENIYKKALEDLIVNLCTIEKN